MNPLLVCFLLLASLPAQAEAYRWIDPATGRTMISDLPPPPHAKSVSKTKDPTNNPEGHSYALMKAAEAFPVTLYTTASCIEECKQARALLKGRGVPFKEQMLQKPEDFDEVKQLLGDTFIPSLKVGKQGIRGFEASSYNNLLDLAGYPTQTSISSKSGGSVNP